MKQLKNKIKHNIGYMLISLFLFSILVEYMLINNLISTSKMSIGDYWIKYKYGIGLFIGLIFFFAVMGLLKKIGFNNQKIMLCGILGFEIFYFCLLPLGIVPDEREHFLRAYEISDGNFVSKHMLNSKQGGDRMPGNLRFFQYDNVEIDTKNYEDYIFSNTALYAPVSYIPQTIGILIGKLFTDSVKKIFIFGRMGSAIINFLICAWALKKTPVAKSLMFAIMMFPVAIQEMISMSPDGFTLSLSFAFIALVLHLKYKKENVSKKDILILMMLAIGVSLCKIVYIVLVMLVFIIPSSKLNNARSVKVGIVGIAMIVNLLWLYIASDYLVEFNHGVNSGEQIMFVVSHPHAYFQVVSRTVFDSLQGWISTAIGSNLGYLNIAVTSLMWIVYAIVVMNETYHCSLEKIKLQKQDSIVFLGIPIVGFILVCTSLYVQWTEYMACSIAGIQGRYFLPFLLLILLFFVQQHQKKYKANSGDSYEHCDRKYLLLIIFFCNCLALIDIVEFKILLGM